MKHTIKTLKAELRDLDIKLPARAKKSELVALLQAVKNTKTKTGYSKATAKKQAKTMKAVMDISDRRIVNTETGEEYETCNKAYKAEQFSSAQCDRLSGVLFKALRAGEEIPVVELRGRGSWTLASAYEA